VPVAQTSTAAYFHYAGIASQTASLLGRNQDARKYADLAKAIRATFNAKYLDTATGLYAKDSQTAQALPLALDLAPEAKQALILDQLVQSISGSRQNHISAGIVGALYLFHVLMEHGRDDLAWAIIAQEDYPGWLHMINQGATSIWEAWNGGGSRNHPTFGCVGFWFYQGLAGLRPDPAAPGFKKIIIHPAVVGNLAWAKARYDSIHGRILSGWKREGSQLFLDVTIPPNTTATLFVPAQDAHSVRESGRLAAVAEAVKFLRTEPGTAVFAVGSGSYSFVSTLPTLEK
jgi:alpha-L-rhamnosidase